MTDVVSTELQGVLELVPRQIKDDRGFFSETYSATRFTELGIDLQFCQDNHSLSHQKGVLRGLHFQLPPFAQDKLVRVIRGAIFDVAVDIRRGSPTYGHWVGREISAARWNQLLVPKGFAHGFLTLEAETEVIYKVTAPYSAVHDRSIRFDDPAIGIGWPGDASNYVLSDKDRAAPVLAASDPFKD